MYAFSFYELRYWESSWLSAKKKEWLYSPSHFDAIHNYMDKLNAVQSCTTVQSSTSTSTSSNDYFERSYNFGLTVPTCTYYYPSIVIIIQTDHPPLSSPTHATFCTGPGWALGSDGRLKVDSHLSGRPGPYGHSGPDTGQLAGTAKVEHPGPPADFPAHPACGHCR